MSDADANLLVAPAELAAPTLRVEGDRYRHLFRARRLALGAVLRLVDGEGQARRAVVTAIDRHGADLTLGEPLAGEEPAPAVTLWVAMPKPERAAWLVEKATELGVVAVRFLAVERAVRSPAARELERLRRVAAAALEQCGGARLPAIDGPHELAALARLLGGEPAAFLDPAAELPLAKVAPGIAAVLVGPEGGWTPTERETLVGAGLTGARLGERTLRVETAALAAAALLLLGPDA
jgi:16S rRNA (uracil1498-N3)-methyltransferase